MNSSLSGAELLQLVQRVFAPRPDDTGVGLLVDLPLDAQADTFAWQERRALAAAWWETLAGLERDLGLPVRLYLYPAVGQNNADLPQHAWHHSRGTLPATAADLAGPAERFVHIFERNSILIAPTQYSATAPLKVAAREHSFRAATMPGFSPAMVPALRLDYEEVNRRVERLTQLLDDATAAELRFVVDGADQAELELDLRHRRGHASGGLLRQPGIAGNLPSGESYIVPYEGELAGDPSRSHGVLPVELDGEVVRYRIEENHAVAAEGDGAAARREAAHLEHEPAYGNVAELGLGVLGEMGVTPVGAILLDEKLGLHVAFGRSDHFGGVVGPAQFTSPAAVVHEDRVYLPQLQPRISVAEVVLCCGNGGHLPLIRDDAWVIPIKD